MNMDFLGRVITDKLLDVHTAYIARVISVRGNTAIVQPMTYTKTTSGQTVNQAPVRAVVPKNVKYKEDTIRYRASDNDYESKTVLVPAELVEGDLVYCGVCERDITAAVNGGQELPTRHHNINDSVILKVLGGAE